MQNLLNALPHLVMALAVIAAMSVLAALGVVTGQVAAPIIAAAGGFTLGGTIGSGSVPGTFSGSAGASTSISAPAATQVHVEAAPAATPTPVA